MKLDDFSPEAIIGRALGIETPTIRIRPRHRRAGWLTVDLRDADGVGLVVVVPAFGPDHRAGLDCWCHPRLDGDGTVVVHEAAH